MLISRVAGLALCALPSLASASEAPAAIDSIAAMHERARVTQQSIDRVHEQTMRARDELRRLEHDRISGATGAELQQRVAQLEADATTLEEDLRAAAGAQVGIVALLAAMVDALDAFVALDLPFRAAERAAAIRSLRQLATDSEAAVADKLQAVVAAYLREIDYGHTTEFGRASITTASGEHVVDLLRIGRAGLWYVTPDGMRAGRYDRAAATWLERGVDPEAVRRAGAIATGRAAGPRIALPVETPP